MRLRHLAATLSLVALAACGKNPPPETPTPRPEPPVEQPKPQPSAPIAQPPKTDDGAAAATAAAELTRRLLVDLTETVLFDYDKADVRGDETAKLDRKSAILAANAGVAVRIAGNADERGSDEYNLALGMRRATAAKRYLEGKGVDGSRLEAVSYGEERPLDPAKSEDAFAKNRRDDFEVVRGGDRLVAPR